MVCLRIGNFGWFSKRFGWRWQDIKREHTNNGTDLGLGYWMESALGGMTLDGVGWDDSGMGQYVLIVLVVVDGWMDKLAFQTLPLFHSASVRSVWFNC